MANQLQILISSFAHSIDYKDFLCTIALQQTHSDNKQQVVLLMGLVYRLLGGHFYCLV